MFVVSKVLGEGETTLTWRLGGGSATKGVDYEAPTLGTMKIGAGPNEAKIEVPTVQDDEVELDETVALMIQWGSRTEGAVGLIIDDDASELGEPALTWKSPLVIVEGAWIVFLLLLVVLAKCRNRFGVSTPVELRGLNLPSGSVRAILALFSVGSFVIVMVFGGPALGTYYDMVLAAFGSLTGSIIGFYFGNRELLLRHRRRRVRRRRN